MVDAQIFDLTLWETLMDLLPVVVSTMSAFFVLDVVFYLIKTMTKVSKGKKRRKREAMT